MTGYQDFLQKSPKRLQSFQEGIILKGAFLPTISGLFYEEPLL